MSQQALQMQSAYTMNGTPLTAAGGQALIGAMNGTNANPYMGQNPYLSDMINNSNNMISNAYTKGTAAQTDSAFARGGAYGGSAYQDQVGQNQLQLLGALGNNTNTLLGQNYNQSSQLAENALNRSVQAAEVGQGQQGLDQQAITAMLTAGQAPQQYEQALLNAGQTNYQQAQQAPFTLSDYLRNALTSASGTGGTQTTTAPGMSPITGLLGAGALASGLYYGK